MPRQPGLKTCLSAVGATGAGIAVPADGRSRISMQVDVTSVSSGGAIALEGTVDGLTWARLTPKDGDATGLAISNRVGTISNTGTYIMEYENVCVAQVRPYITAWTDGAWTVKVRTQD